MSQHNAYSSSGIRSSQLGYDSVRGTPVPLQELPMRPQYAFETQLGGPRMPCYEQDSRGMVFRDLDQGRPAPITADSHIRIPDSQRADLQQTRQPRMLQINDGIRYGQPEVHEAPAQTWSNITFTDSDLVDQYTNGHSMAPEQPTFEGSPRPSLGRAAKPSARTSGNSSDDNLSTATTAVDSGRSSDPDTNHLLRGIALSLAEIKQNQVEIKQNQATIIKKMETMDTATTTRLSDFREHTDKKFERVLGAMEYGFDEIWDKQGSTSLEIKRVRDLMSGHDPRRSPPADDGNYDIGAKRRRFED